VQDDSAVDISEEIARLQKKSSALTKEFTPSCLPGRSRRWRAIPSVHTRSTISRTSLPTSKNCWAIVPFAEDPSIIGGLARFGSQTVMVIGHQKGRDTKDKLYGISACPSRRDTERRCG